MSLFATAPPSPRHLHRPSPSVPPSLPPSSFHPLPSTLNPLPPPKKGPEVRSGDLAEPIEMLRGQSYTFTITEGQVTRTET